MESRKEGKLSLSFLTLPAGALALSPGPIYAQDENPDFAQWTDLHPPPTYWQNFLDGSPIYQALHVLLVAAFIGSLVSHFRRISPPLALALAVGPFLCGALAAWAGVARLVILTLSWSYEGDVYAEVAALPRPFELGLLLSGAALILRFFRRASPPA